MKHEGPQQTDAEPAEADGARAKTSRRRLLYGSAGILLLGVGAVRKAAQDGLPAAAGAGGSGTGSAGAAVAPPPPFASAPGSASGPAPASVEASPPQLRVAAAPKYYVDDAGPTAIALTLDDGPHPVYTPQVLDILDRYGIQATFNMIGSQIGANLALVREVAAAGHTITNHTWDHADLRRYSSTRVLSEIDRCNEALAEAGQQPSIFRAPYGYWTPSVFEACAARDLTPLGWSVDPQDWDTAHVSAAKIVTTVLRRTRRHDIILEHDGGGDRSNTVAALRIFVPELLARGFVFTAV
ncbi:MAG TPA: polysaccharide deacetylase family protein [Actinospica sp.]|nr:polysaccharide deacetylase family protein [Actinospica sp.]